MRVLQQASTLPLVPGGDEASATATALIRSPYSCCLQCRGWAPYSPERTRHLRPLPGTSSTLHGADALHTHIDKFCRSDDPKRLDSAGPCAGSTPGRPSTRNSHEPCPVGHGALGDADRGGEGNDRAIPPHGLQDALESEHLLAQPPSLRV
jgi:hypothetical protein